MDQNSVLFLLSSIVQGLAAVMAIIGTFMVFVYSLKWGSPPTKKRRYIWLGSTFGLALLLLVTITYSLILIPISDEFSNYQDHISRVQFLAILCFVILFVYIILVQLLMQPKILAVDLKLTDLSCRKTDSRFEGEFTLQNFGSDMARDVKLFVELKSGLSLICTDRWDVSLKGKGSPYIQDGGIKKYKTRCAYEFFRGDLHAGDFDHCNFELHYPLSSEHLIFTIIAIDAYGFKSTEASYSLNSL